MNLEKVLNSTKPLTDAEVLSKKESLDLNLVLQNNKLEEDTLKKIISFVDLRTLIKTQEYSPEFANDVILPHVSRFSHRNPISTTEILDSQKDRWVGVTLNISTNTFHRADNPAQRTT